MKYEAADTAELVPPEMREAIEALAEQEHRAPSELVREALEQYMEDREWQKLLAFGQQRAKELGLNEDDVPRLIAEVRRDRNRQGSGRS